MPSLYTVSDLQAVTPTVTKYRRVRLSWKAEKEGEGGSAVTKWSVMQTIFFNSLEYSASI